MKKLAFLFACAIALSSLPAAARGQVAVQIQIALPAAPPLVVVQPGVQVVEDQDEEVFYTRGWYWVQRDGVWYRARAPRASFVFVDRRFVPVALVRMPPGHYRHWRREEARDDRREWKEHRRHERKKEHDHGREHHDRRDD
jgi:hypothetical protein